MERDWTDKDGQRWLVRAYHMGGAMATAPGGQIPDAGKDKIRFRYADSSEGHAVETGDLRDPNEMTDEELQELLDKATESSGAREAGRRAGGVGE